MSSSALKVMGVNDRAISLAPVVHWNPTNPCGGSREMSKKKGKGGGKPRY